MKKLYELRDKLCDQLAEYGDKELTSPVLEVVDKLAHATKNLDKVIAKCEGMDYEGSYSGAYYPRNSYGSYDRGRGVGRNSMGRYDNRYSGGYSGDDGMIHELTRLMDDAPDERTRMELQKFIDKMRTM